MRYRPPGFCPIRGVQVWIDCDLDDFGIGDRPVLTSMPFNTPSGNRHLAVIRATDYEMILLDHSEKEQQTSAVAYYLNPEGPQCACFQLQHAWDWYTTNNKYPFTTFPFTRMMASTRAAMPSFVTRLITRARKFRVKSANTPQ